jgi:RNA polymerase sigma factor (sigma-70 family)
MREEVMDDRDRIIRYRFTAYLIEAVKNRKAKYLVKRAALRVFEILYDDLNELHGALPEHHTEGDPLDRYIVNADLREAFKRINTRDLRVFMMHAVEGYSLREISSNMDIKYNTVLSIFNRTKKKIAKGSE